MNDIISKIDAFISKQQNIKVYLKPGEEPPEGIQLMRGRRGGLYYRTEEKLKPKEFKISEKMPKKHPAFGEFSITSIKDERGNVGSNYIHLITYASGKFSKNIEIQPNFKIIEKGSKVRPLGPIHGQKEYQLENIDQIKSFLINVYGLDEREIGIVETQISEIKDAFGGFGIPEKRSR